MRRTPIDRAVRSSAPWWSRMLLAGAKPASLDLCEPRLVLDASYPFALYYPEGYAADNINEFVPITNPNPTPVDVRLSVRYEFGTRDQVVGTQTIPAFSRGGFTLSDSANPAATVVTKGVPYSIIVESTQQVSANFSHYDFGTAVGEAFTATTSNIWTFADGLKDTTISRDFILVFNPTDNIVSATITLYGQGGITTTNTITVGAQRRAGWSVEDIPAQPAGLFAARVTATGTVVAAQTHYELLSSRGWGLLGQPDGGSRAGTIPKLGFDDAFYDTNGEGPNPGTRYESDSFVSFLNTSPSTATITMRFVYDNTALGYYQTNVTIPAFTMRQISMRDLGFASGDKFGLLYTSTGFVTAVGTLYQGADATGATAAVNANDQWDFGEGYMSQSRGGTSVLEEIRMFNPNASPVDITFDIFFFDGTSIQITDTLDGGELVSAHLDQYAVIRNHAPDSWYGIRLTATSQIVAMMEHWDSGNGGGFSTFGMPTGTNRPLDTYVLTP